MRNAMLCRVSAAVMIVSAVAVVASPGAWARGITNFGGYSAPMIASASADITVPATSSISCSSAKGAAVDLWVGLTRGQYAANAGLEVECVHGSPITFVSGAAGTASFRFPVYGGDIISISASETAQATAVTANDTTTSVNEEAFSVGATTTPTVVQFGATSTAKVIPNFGPVAYSSATVDGAPLNASVATAHKLVRGHPPGVVPGPIASGSFTLTEP